MISLTAGGASDTATNFENVLTGQSDSEVLGTSGANIIITQQGNDSIDGRGGGDSIFAGAGDDYVVFDFADTIDLGAGDDTVEDRQRHPSNRSMAEVATTRSLATSFGPTAWSGTLKRGRREFFFSTATYLNFEHYINNRCRRQCRRVRHQRRQLDHDRRWDEHDPGPRWRRHGSTLAPAMIRSTAAPAMTRWRAAATMTRSLAASVPISSTAVTGERYRRLLDLHRLRSRSTCWQEQQEAATPPETSFSELNTWSDQAQGDLFFGDAQVNSLFGGDGIDAMQGGAGADYLDGGANLDWALYFDAPGPLVVDLETPVKQFQLISAKTPWSPSRSLAARRTSRTRSRATPQAISSSAVAHADDLLYGGGGGDLLQGGVWQ